MAIIDEIITDVKECDRRIVEWFDTHGVIKPRDVLHIYRPELVLLRLEIMEKLGFIQFDEDKVAHRILDIPLDVLPLNCDIIEDKINSEMVWIVYSIIANSRPKSYREITETINRMFEENITESHVQNWMKTLRKLGLVKKEGDRYIPNVNLYVDDLYELYEKWKRNKGVGRRKKKWRVTEYVK